jgi:SAM-dependent methyltransferase
LFIEQGGFMATLLQKFGGLEPDHDVIEIGCGCGCAALGLTSVLTGGSYKGLDIDALCIDSCKANRAFKRRDFSFEWMDVHSAQYNPGGAVRANEFEFPYADNSADLLFLTSVFTHMLPEDVRHYISEIARVLRPGGTLFFTTFLMDHGTEGDSINFPYELPDCRIHQRSVPERAVGYYRQWLVDTCAVHSLHEKRPPAMGNWRVCASDGDDPEAGFGQDVMVFELGNGG